MTMLVAAEKDIIIGAIRWDAWVGDTMQSMAPISILSQKMLSPSKFRFRAPFFGVADGENVTFRTRQATIDAEIEYAKNGGIDYFLFQWYSSNSGFNIPLDKYLSSKHKDDVKFAYLFYSTNFPQVRQEMSQVITRMKLSNYQTVNGGKPLVYLMHNTWTDDDISTLKNAAQEAGLAELYLVFMDWHGQSAASTVKLLGGQAISAYCRAGSGGQKYSDFAKSESSYWDSYKNTGEEFIPFVTTGWDPRPIGEYTRYAQVNSPEEYANIKQWYPDTPKPDYYVQTATPKEIADHLKDAMDYAYSYQKSTYPKTVIMYAWNECSEGGWLIPTLEGGSQRLDAIKSMLNDYKAPINSITSSSIQSSPVYSKPSSVYTSSSLPISSAVSNSISYENTINSVVSDSISSKTDISGSSVTSEDSDASYSSGNNMVQDRFTGYIAAILALLVIVALSALYIVKKGKRKNREMR